VAAEGFLGVLDAGEPAAALRRIGVEPAWCDRRVAFGGAPAWTDRTGAVVVSGEVVLDNAAELQEALGLSVAAPGELLAELYCRDGRAGLGAALGMFALAIWDGARGELVLARDGVGARTLYFAREGRAWWFAARLRTLRRTPAVSAALSLTALRKYLTFAFVPGEETLWRDARELRPGTLLRLPEARTEGYWEPAEHKWDPEEPIAPQAKRLRALLDESVRVRMPEDGPVGVFLSGGLDSSLVTALAAAQAPGRVHTYSVHFGADLPNELAYSGLVAAHCGTHHHVIEVSARQVEDCLAATVRALDDPIGDPLTVPNLLLAGAAAKDVGVVLNGEGGDPGFGGPKNLPMLLHTLYAPEQSREVAYLRAFQKCYDDLPRLLRPEVQATLRLAEPQEALLSPYLTAPRMAHYLNRLTYLNVRLKGADHILTKVSNLTRAAGLLGRSPLFDRRVIDAGFALPPAHKLRGAEEKVVLKRAVADLLPEAILTRPKSGMLVPVQRWFKGDLRPLATRLLLDRRARVRPYLNDAPIREWLAGRGNLWPRHGVKLWLVLTLEAWLRAQEGD
jgi:asparagine synthase (glutamine-hydrolysing)